MIVGGDGMMVGGYDIVVDWDDVSTVRKPEPLPTVANGIDRMTRSCDRVTLGRSTLEREMAEIELTPKQRQQLKGAAHRLAPVVLLGAGGLTDAVVREIDRALAAHELIKVRVPGDDRAQRDEIFRTVAERLGAARVQMIGKLLVLFRPRPAAATTQAAAPPRAHRASAAKPPPVAPARTKADRREIRAAAPKPAPRRTGRPVERTPRRGGKAKSSSSSR